MGRGHETCEIRGGIFSPTKNWLDNWMLLRDDLWTTEKCQQKIMIVHKILLLLLWLRSDLSYSRRFFSPRHNTQQKNETIETCESREKSVKRLSLKRRVLSSHDGQHSFSRAIFVDKLPESWKYIIVLTSVIIWEVECGTLPTHSDSLCAGHLCNENGNESHQLQVVNLEVQTILIFFSVISREKN